MNAAAVRHLRRLALALVLGLFALWATVGATLAACQTVSAAACGPIRFEGAPSSKAVGVQIGSTCTQPGTTDYQVTLSGPGGYSRVLAQGSVSTGTDIVPMQVIKVPAEGDYTLTVTTTTNQGETGSCITGTTVRTVSVPTKPKPTPTPSASPTPSPSPTPKPTKEPTAPPEQVTEPPTDQPTDATEAPTEIPAESAGPATFEPNPSMEGGTPRPTPTPAAGGGGTGGGGGPDLMTLVLVGVILVGGIGAAAAALLYVRQNRLSADAPWRAGPWKCARCNAINREGTERCRRCYAKWDGTP